MRVSAHSCNVLSVEIVAFTLTDAMRQRDIVCRVHQDRLRGGLAAAVGICACNGVGARIANRYRSIGGSIAPHVRACTCSRKRHVVSLTETTVASNIDIGQRINSNRNIRRIRTAFRVGGGYGIDTALAHGDAAVRTGIAPNVGGAAVGGKCGALALTDYCVS